MTPAEAPKISKKMEINVDQLTGERSRLRFEGTRSWWEARCGEESQLATGSTAEVGEPLVFDLFAYATETEVYLEGSVAGVLDAECNRCLARYRHPLRDEFRVVLEPARGRVPDDPEDATALRETGICLGDELELGWYQGPRIHLGDLFGEVVALAWPGQTVCGEDCKGLCPHCGIDRNVSSCDCHDEKRESPFAALAALQTRTSPNDETSSD